MKDTYDYESKKAVRLQAKEFLSRNHSSAQLKNAKVLTLMGHENNELTQIWDPLGVQRQNITVIEQNSDSYKIIQQKIIDENWNVKLEPKQNITTFLGETRQKFDIINLDYQGYFDKAKEEDLTNIISKQLLYSGSTLLTWYSGRRENLSSQNLMHSLETNAKAKQVMRKLAYENNLDKEQQLIDELRQLRFSSTQPALDINRDLGITSYLTDLMSLGRSVDLKFLHPIIIANKLQSKLVPIVENGIHAQKLNHFLLYILKTNKSELAFDNGYGPQLLAFKRIRDAKLEKREPDMKDRYTLAELYFPEAGQKLAMHEAEKIVMNQINNLSYEYRHINAEFAGMIAHLLFMKDLKAYMQDSMERYFYHGDKGTPMYVDFLHLVQPETPLIKYDIKSNGINLHASTFKNITYTKINRIGEIAKATAQSINPDFFPKRINIDDLFTEQKSKNKIDEKLQITTETNYAQTEVKAPQTITQIVEPAYDKQNEKVPKEKIYELLRSGVPAAEIYTAHPEYNPKQIAAYQAYITMDERGVKRGRHKKTREQIVETPASKIIHSTNIPVQDTLNKMVAPNLTKREVIELLSLGFDSKEIAETYNTSVYKIRPYKAHITMGTYQKAI